MIKIECSSVLIFLILVFSCGGNDDSQIQITVSATDFSITIDENPEANAIIGTVIGSSNQGDVTFSITSQNPSNSFNINQTTGELTVNIVDNFDYEINPVITGVINVSNGNVSKTSIVTINLNDLNEPNVFVGNLDFSSQEDINDFGAKEYTEVTGWVNFNNSSGNISSLAPLMTLTKISEDLLIRSCHKLKTLNGLENLSFVGGHLVIGLNEQLESIEALKNIKNTIGDLRVSTNDQLKSLEGLNNLTNVGGRLVIRHNENLIDISALRNLISVKDDLSIMGDNSFTTLEGLNNLNSIGGKFTISWTLLKTLKGLDSLSEIKGLLGLEINGNDDLVNLDGFNSNVSLNSGTDFNSIGISGNLSLTNIDGLSKFICDEFTLININENPSLININGLTPIYKSGGISILGNSALVNVDGLINIKTISLNGNLELKENTSLNDLCGITPLIKNNGISGIGSYIVSGNLFNPSEQDILDENCKN
ncbi:cadherin repeat domain-containing protein [Thalassobellus sediminis]|uniref:cadherin repeat domain-containing protein n=1 Tax=Thalassobellus sediminis TaxID=3367753 RepID=UPI0037B3E7CE